MNETITCSVKDAMEYMKHLDENDMVTLTIDNIRTHVHSAPTRIKKKNGVELIKQAKSIEYQNNDFFGRISLFGVLKDKNVVNNILFHN